MVNVRKNAMREYHNLVHRKKYMQQEPKKYPTTFKYMSNEEFISREKEYESVCQQIELLKKILQIN